jgi:hypothetical protein
MQQKAICPFLEKEDISIGPIKAKASLLRLNLDAIYWQLEFMTLRFVLLECLLRINQ